MYPSQAPGLTTALAPSAVVTKGRWVDSSGDQMTSAGGRARGIAYQNFSATDLANVAGYPPARLTVIVFGPAKTELGGTVPDKSFVTTDANGKTIVATTANHEILGYIEKGGVAGDEREIFVLRNDDTRVPAAGIADLAAISGGESPTEAEHNAVITKVNAIIAALEAQKITAVV